MKTGAWAGLVLTVILVCGANAAVLNVPSDYGTIQKGIDAAVDGDTVLVAPGLYFEQINFSGKNITVTSTDPTDSGIVGYTVINARQKGAVVSFKGGEDNRAVLTGFTLSGGTGRLVSYRYSDSGYVETDSYYYGGGIDCNYASPTITHNVITGNTLPPYLWSYVDSGDVTTYTYVVSYGGGIYASGSPVIMYNVISRNAAHYGGGICCYGGTIRDNVIYDNSGGYGGGVRFSSSYGSLTNNTIVGNDVSLYPESGRGGNVYAYMGSDTDPGLIANNIICNADSGGGVYWYGDTKKATLFRYNNVWGNTPSDYVTEDQRTYEILSGPAAAWTGHNGNISADPGFITDWSKKYRIADASPCVSAGDPNFAPLPGETDIDGDPRVYALRVDIGADEHVGYVRPIAEAGPAQHVLTPQTITLEGGSSYFSDPNAGVSYHWTQTQGTSVQLSDPNVARPTFTPSEEGWYAFQLVVGDSQYTSEPDQVLVIVGNARPVANAGPDKLWQAPGYVLLDGSGSYDADPIDRLTCTWTQLEGPTVSLQETQGYIWFASAQPATYVFQLVVNDGFADSEPDTVKIETATFTQSAQLLPVTTMPDIVTSTNYVYSFYPSCAGTDVVYAGGAGTTTPSSWSIYRSDPRTGATVKYDSGAIDTKPKADGDITVWVGGAGNYYDPICTSLCAANVATGTTVTKLLTATATTSYGYPAISGRTVVYLRHTNVDKADAEKYANCSYDICAMDISDFAHPVTFTIATAAGHGMPYPYDNYSYDFEDYVDVSGDLVVWEQDGDIYGADISDRSHIKVFPICTAPERQHDPAISGHTVVWTDERNDMGDIYGADISDPNHVREFEVCVQSGWECQPDIDGSVIVYTEGDDVYGYVRVCCLTREYGVASFSLANPYSYYGACPSVHGSVMAWRGGNRSSYDISSVRLDLAYALANGPIRNATTGACYDYVQHAISASSNGDVIVVPPGTYDERIRFGGKNVTLRSTDPNDPAVRRATVFKGDGQLVTFADDETAACLFTGFTLTGSIGLCCDRASPTITLCDMVGCRDAGMKHLAFAKPLVSRCTMTANGIGVELATELLSRAAGYATPILQNCLIVGNRTYGVYGGDPVVSNCTIADNGDLGVSGVHPTIRNSIVYFNNAAGSNVKGKLSLAVSYSDVQGGAPGTGNLNVDPCFALRGTRVEGAWIDGDYHLASAGWRWSPAGPAWVWDDKTSPCIDAADPAAPLGEENPCGSDDPLSARARPNTRLDMGAYGGTAEASLAPKP